MFTQEFEKSIANMKYLALNITKFRYPSRAFVVLLC